MDKGCLFDCEGFREIAGAKPKTGYVPLEMYQEMVSGEKDMRRKIQEMYSNLKEELAAKDKELEDLKDKLSGYYPISGLPDRRVYGRFVSGREDIADIADIADRGFEKIVRDTEWMDQDDYYLLYSLRESNRRFRNRKS